MSWAYMSYSSPGSDKCHGHDLWAWAQNLSKKRINRWASRSWPQASAGAGRNRKFSGGRARPKADESWAAGSSGHARFWRVRVFCRVMRIWGSCATISTSTPIAHTSADTSTESTQKNRTDPLRRSLELDRSLAGARSSPEPSTQAGRRIPSHLARPHSPTPTPHRPDPPDK